MGVCVASFVPDVLYGGVGVDVAELVVSDNTLEFLVFSPNFKATKTNNPEITKSKTASFLFEESPTLSV